MKKRLLSMALWMRVDFKSFLIGCLSTLVVVIIMGQSWGSSSLGDHHREVIEKLDNIWEATAGDAAGLFMHYGVAENSIHSILKACCKKR